LFSPRLVDIALAFLDGIGNSRSWKEIVGAAKKLMPDRNIPARSGGTKRRGLAAPSLFQFFTDA
jgi:hypothetical protein